MRRHLLGEPAPIHSPLRMGASTWGRITGAVVLAVACGMLAVGAYTVYHIAQDPSARLQAYESQLSTTTTGPNASFTWSSRGYNVTFTDASTDNGSTITSWQWTFGDGTDYSGSTPPMHTYSTTCPECTEQVSLVVQDSAGDQSTATANVQVQQTGTASGSSQSNSASSHVPKLGAGLTELPNAVELLLVMFLIGGSSANAGLKLLQREPDPVEVPVRPRTPLTP